VLIIKRETCLSMKRGYIEPFGISCVSFQRLTSTKTKKINFEEHEKLKSTYNLFIILQHCVQEEMGRLYAYKLYGLV
jgi:hypothetical protein